jgi:hypothetical protein
MKVIFGSNNLPLSVLIKLFTWSKWSHCGVVDGDYVIEARALKGVVRTPLKEFIARYNRIEIATLPTLRDHEQIMKLSELEMGKPYDFSAVFGIAFRTGWADPSKWFCSELVAHLSGLFRKEYEGRIVPDDLIRLCV